jgi:DMSO/TMAO reductase YedYZ molybdopterin-dependent catalytic subunit
MSDHNEEVLARMRRQTRRSFFVAGGAALAGLAGWEWLMSRRKEDNVPWPMRRMLAINEGFWRDYFSPNHLAPDFAGKVPLEDRVNSDIGLETPLVPEEWKLTLAGLAEYEDGYEMNLDDLRKMPRTTMTTEFKCVEGWSAVMEWSGVRFSDFMAAAPPQKHNGALPPYVSLETPDKTYYVSVDMESMQHPQTLLAYEMNGAPLTEDHGAPLRLVTPVKYGLKQIKRIGSIRYQLDRGADYWTERGYDWYVGL